MDNPIKKTFKTRCKNFYHRLRTSNASKWLIGIIAFLFLLLTFWGIGGILHENAGNAVFKALGFAVVMAWACIFLCYFIWATYFYNLNFGITNKDWKNIYDAKNKRKEGLAYNKEDIGSEPLYNPYHEETFGLPAGTVRGMIAFTLLFGAVGLLIVSFGMESSLNPDSFFYDQFEFFKTAFLMMVAFYFGSRSLSYFKTAQVKNPINSRSEVNQRNEILRDCPPEETPEPMPVFPTVSSERQDSELEDKLKNLEKIVSSDPMQAGK